MARVMILGTGPLPLYENNRLYAFGVRTWHFARSVLEAGHETKLITFEFGKHESIAPQGSCPRVQIGETKVPERLNHVPLPEPNAENFPSLAKALDELIDLFQPDAVVTAGSTLPARVAVHCKYQGPLWLDLFGDTMSEVQAKLAFAPAAEIDFFLRLQMGLLIRGDIFSAVSENQKDAVIGQLSMAGRLVGSTRNYELVHVIPVASDEREPPADTTDAPKCLRGEKVPPDAFIVLWSGGFNTWADIETLFKGLEKAMEDNPKIYFAASGGAISGHHETGFEHFQDLVARSCFKDHFIVLGWLPNESIPALYKEADVGINVDLDIYESRLGSRCRLVNWMKSGLPCITTETTELSRIMKRNGLGFVVPPGDEQALTKQILQLAEHPEPLEKVAAKAREYTLNEFSFEATVQPLLKWLDNPSRSPDRTGDQRLSQVRQLLNQIAFPATERAEETNTSWLERLLGKKN